MESLKLNDYSEDLKKEVATHRPTKDKPVKFRILAGHPNLDPDKEQRELQPWLYPAIVTIRSRATIMQPNGDFVEIGNPVNMGRDGKTPEFEGINIQEHTADGFFYVHYNDQKMMKAFPLLWLSPERKGSPGANDAVTPIYEFVDTAKEARTRIENRKAKQTAQRLLDDMDYGEMQDIATMYPTLRLPSATGDLENDKDILYDMLCNIVEKDPAEFARKASSPDLDKYVTITKAIKAGVIGYTSDTNGYVIPKTGETIVSFGFGKQGNPTDLLIDWLSNNPNGEQAYHNIKSLLPQNDKTKKITRAKKDENTE